MLTASIAGVAVTLLGLQASCGVVPNPSATRSTDPSTAVRGAPARAAGTTQPATRGGTTGTTVPATQDKSPDTTVPTTEVTIASAPSTGPAAAAGSTAATTASTGKHSVLVMMVHWGRPDATTPAAAQNEIAVNVNNWYAATSYNQLGFTGTATPWMTVAPSDCSLASGGYWNLLALAQAQARARGYNPSAYDHEMVYFPFNPKCDFGGLGTTGDRYTWVNGEMTTRVTAHELGHNLGLHHASSATCTDASGAQVTVSATCTHDEYGDLFDAMGAVFSGTPRDFNAAQKNRLGWLNGRLATVTAGQSVTLAPLANGGGVVAARIVAGNSEYWLEYRRPTGVDSSLAYYPGATDGVLVHRNTREGATELLDGRPDGYKSFANAAVPVGSTLRTPEGMTTKVKSANGSTAVVEIAFASAPK